MAEVNSVQFLQGTNSAGATANGNGTPADVAGFLAAQQVEVAETAGGTVTLSLQGSFDGTNWYACGYQRVDNQASPSRAVADISVTASLRAVYQLLDPYPQVRAKLASVAGGATVTIKLYGVCS